MPNSLRDNHKKLLDEEERLVAPLRARRLEIQEEIEMEKGNLAGTKMFSLLSELFEIEKEIEAFHRTYGMRSKTEDLRKIVK